MKIDYSQLEFLDPMLRKILGFIESIDSAEQTITSLYRIGDKGVHGTLPLRGTDLRCRNKDKGRAIESRVNSLFTYDPKRPEVKCAFLHGEGSNLHLHIQVHPNTVVK
jgi:hypothetical protein